MLPPQGISLVAALALGIGGLAPGALYAAAPHAAPSPSVLPPTIGLLQQASSLGQFAGPVVLGLWVEHLGWHAAPAILVPAALFGLPAHSRFDVFSPPPTSEGAANDSELLRRPDDQDHRMSRMHMMPVNRIQKLTASRPSLDHGNENQDEASSRSIHQRRRRPPLMSSATRATRKYPNRGKRRPSTTSEKMVVPTSRYDIATGIGPKPRGPVNR
jgi:hypothetical protein